MKKLFIILILMAGLSSCTKLNLNPLSDPASGSFYSNQNELTLAVNDLYRIDFWSNDNEYFSDNSWHRGQLTNAVIGGTMNADDATANSLWTNAYKAIARVNTFLANDSRAAGNTPAATITRLEAEMRLIRGYEYARLISHFGDVPLLTEPTDLSASYNIMRKPKDSVLSFIYQDLDFAATNLPTSYTTSDIRRFTKGSALAIKARIALYMGKWRDAATAADGVMQLAATGQYSLNASYRDLFLKAGETSKEMVISVPREQAQQVFNGAAYVQDFMPRNAGGFGAAIPTREMVDAYECTDGLTIDKSALYDPKNPFANRDPRLTANIVEFNTQWLGYAYQPHPDTLTVFSSKENKRVSNKDNRVVATFASYTGFLWKKGIDQTWVDRLVEDNDAIIIRYAEILLTYAEAKIELGEADASVINAINQVRARAYGVAVTASASYPAIPAGTTDIAKLRSIVRRERRVEFPLEGLRYMDLIRWKLAEKALSKPVIGIPDPAAQNRSKWPFPGATPIDADGIADYASFGTDVKILITRTFDKNRQYLWPIPNQDRALNKSLSQNPNY